MHRIAVAGTVIAALAVGTACNGDHAPRGLATARPLVTSPISSSTVTPPTSRSAGPHSHVARAVVPVTFRSRTRPVTATALGKSWHPGCPVPASSLRALTVTYWGFDHTAHSGTLIVNALVVPAVTTAMRRLYTSRFAIRRMVPIAAYLGDDNKSMAADNTSGFNCRYAVASGSKQWSMHAYGEAIDFNPVENPYTLDGRIYPPSGKAYTNRHDVRPGMAVPGSALVRAFDAVGWGWGGRWADSPDYQHFSANGR